MPLLPGHGTVVDDMMPTRWADWAGEADAAFQRLSQRVQSGLPTSIVYHVELHRGVNKAHPCGAGLGLVGVSTEGEIHGTPRKRPGSALSALNR